MKPGEALALLLANYAMSMSNGDRNIKRYNTKKYDIDMREINGVWYPVLSDNYD